MAAPIVQMVETGRDQSGQPGNSTLLGSLVMAARFRGIHLSVPQLVRDHRIKAGEPTVEQLVAIARASGLRAITTRLAFDDMLKLGSALPVIVLLRNGNAMMLAQVEGRGRTEQLVLRDPNAADQASLVLDRGRFETGCTGQVVLIKRDYRLAEDEQPFGLRLILGQLLRDWTIVRDIGIAAFLLGLLALSPIMFWRLLIDKVVYSQSLNTFAVLCLGMAVLVVFEMIFGYLRRHLVIHITKKVDVRISIEIFDKLLNLPVDFFESTPTGEIARDMNEVWKIRKFLTGQLFGTLLDGFVIVVILPVMFFFSTALTLCVLGIALLICIWLLVMLPVVHRKSGAVFQAEGVKNSFLVETLHGIRTVKSLALDARRRQEWDVYVARAATLRFEEGRVANFVQTMVHPLERLMTSGVFALAVYLSLSTQNQTYIGALVAFMMLTMRLAAPLTQLASLLPEYDEARFAVEVIARMVNQPPEAVRSAGGIRTSIKGRIEFDAVTFRYPRTTIPALDRVSFQLSEGSILGVMGRSGSGKTTITRLLQMLHSSYEGTIKLDGHDLRSIDVDHLRSSIGVVLQDNFLFRGTIHETIAAARPDATLEEVIRAARLAGAEEFIDRLPRGYGTWIQEGSTNLSGGQRQRLAIARALISDPRILILDEATSALDAESEAIVNANLLNIAKGRTLLIISHRLSSLTGADAILVLERGQVHDIGRHDQLLERCDLYASLWQQQNRHMLSVPVQEVLPRAAASA